MDATVAKEIAAIFVSPAVLGIFCLFINARIGDIRSQMTRENDRLWNKVDSIEKKLDAHISDGHKPSTTPLSPHT